MSTAERAAWLVATTTVAATLMYGFACAPVNRAVLAVGNADAASTVHVAPSQPDAVLSVGVR